MPPEGGTYSRAAPAPPRAIRLHDPALHWKLLASPRLCVPEAYMDGTLTIEEGSLYDFIDVLCANDAELDDSLPMRLAAAGKRLVRRLHQYNPVPRPRRNVAHHYDLSDQLYELFLDRDRQYSCAYFRSPNDDIDTAQQNKKRHIAAKLLLQPGQAGARYRLGLGRAGALSGRASAAPMSPG